MEDTKLTQEASKSNQSNLNNDKTQEASQENTTILDTELTIKQEDFLQLYCKDEVLRGNGARCYNRAYGYNLDELEKDTAEYKRIMNICSVCASQALIKPNVRKRKIDILNEMLSDREVDSKLAELIDKGDIQAIREYNKLKQRITDKSEVNVKADIVIECIDYAKQSENKG